MATPMPSGRQGRGGAASASSYSGSSLRSSASLITPPLRWVEHIIVAAVASDLAPIKDKALPHNLDAEKTVLGAILVENTDFNGAAELISRDDFYREGHRRIFEAM